MFDWFCSVTCFLKESNMLTFYFPISFFFLTSLWAPLISLHLSQCSHARGAPAELNTSHAQGLGWRGLSPGWHCSSALEQEAAEQMFTNSRCSADWANPNLYTLLVSLQQVCAVTRKGRISSVTKRFSFWRKNKKRGVEKWWNFFKPAGKWGGWSKLHISYSHLSGLEVQDK